MSDITMCNGDGCSKKVSCYRVKATPSKYQSYSNFEEYLDKDGNCKHYILDGRMECTM